MNDLIAFDTLLHEGFSSHFLAYHSFVVFECCDRSWESIILKEFVSCFPSSRPPDTKCFPSIQLTVTMSLFVSNPIFFFSQFKSPSADSRWFTYKWIPFLGTVFGVQSFEHMWVTFIITTYRRYMYDTDDRYSQPYVYMLYLHLIGDTLSWLSVLNIAIPTEYARISQTLLFAEHKTIHLDIQILIFVY